MKIKWNKLYFVVILVIGLMLFVLLSRDFSTPGFAKIEDDQHSYLPLISKPENTPKPTASPTETPLPTPNPSDDWLSHINYLRYQGGLPGVSSDAAWSNGCWLHSRYMVWNDEIGHDEDPNNPGYTTDGDEAAGESNVMVSGSSSSTDKYAIDLWMSGPFHGISILDPQLEVVGFGSYREAVGKWQMGASLDISRGRNFTEPPVGTYPAMWPGNFKSTGILGYHGTEWPDPLTSCPGITADYWNPSGPPIYLQIGSGDYTPDVSATSLKQGSISLDHCVFDETSYVNPNASTQNTGRWILNTRDAIIIMPKDPFVAGQTYTVSITTNGITYTWSFTAESSSQIFFDQPNTLISPR